MLRIEFGVRNHRRDRVERSFSRSIRVVCLQSSLALDQRRRLESGYKHGQVRFHLSDGNAARFVVETWWSPQPQLPETKYLGRRLSEIS